MAIKSIVDFARRHMRELRRATAANVTVTFALATIPMVGFVGAAVDFSHANSVKAALQAATDATALMLSKNASQSNMSASQIQDAATKYLSALFTRPEATDLSIHTSYTTDGGSQITVTSSATIKTDFMGLMGLSTMEVDADAQVKWGNSRLRVALVLDNTGSMADAGKITALKTATNSLLDQLKAAAINNGDVYVSIIPFSKDVNIGPGNYKATWIDWSDWDAANGSCGGKNGNKYHSQSTCQSAGRTWTAGDHSTWNGCVMDRGNSGGPANGNYDTNVTAPSPTNTATWFPAEQYSYCTQAIMPLSYDWTTMKLLVNGMQPNGNTNQAIGLANGWMSLVGGGPYPAPPAMDPNYKYTQVIILLTDGLNTEDRWYTSQKSIDNRQKLTCSNVKAAGIVLYTIQVNTGGDPTSTLLQNCASDSSKFFLLTSANEIVTTFNQIGINLSNLRIAQ